MKHKLLSLIGIVFLVYFVVRNPAGAAHTAASIGGGLANVGSAFGDFFTSLTGGGR